MELHVGDQVQIDTVGAPFHGSWGVITAVEPLEVWVRLVEHSKIFGENTLSPPLRFERWELNLVWCVTEGK